MNKLAHRKEMEGADKIHAVLTGDIVTSSQYAPTDLKRIMQSLRRSAGEFSDAFPGTIRGDLDVFSGDGWQILLADWRKATRLGLFMRAVLRADSNLSADTRVSVGLGSVDKATLNLKRISESTGEAFERSGRALKLLQKPFLMTWGVPSKNSTPSKLEDRLLDGSLRLLDELICRWKSKQAHSVSLALLGKTQDQIARKLQVSQPAVSTSLSSAGWKGIETFLLQIEL
jgi:hypothetical protein